MWADRRGVGGASAFAPAGRSENAFTGVVGRDAAFARAAAVCQSGRALAGVFVPRAMPWRRAVVYGTLVTWPRRQSRGGQPGGLSGLVWAGVLGGADSQLLALKLRTAEPENRRTDGNLPFTIYN